jgi:hypothetical protein
MFQWSIRAHLASYLLACNVGVSELLITGSSLYICEAATTSSALFSAERTAGEPGEPRPSAHAFQEVLHDEMRTWV